MRQQSFTKRRTFFAVVSALLLTGVPSVVYAQGSIGEITGTVRDQNGALIRGAEVQIASDQQGWVRKTVTTDSGLYDFSAVPVGAYTVSVQSTGFKSYTQAGVTLQADLQARVDITLQVGSSSQTVNVTGSAALLETTSSTVQNVIDRERVQNLPLN